MYGVGSQTSRANEWQKLLKEEKRRNIKRSSRVDKERRRPYLRLRRTQTPAAEVDKMFNKTHNDTANGRKADGAMRPDD